MKPSPDSPNRVFNRRRANGVRRVRETVKQRQCQQRKSTSSAWYFDRRCLLFVKNVSPNQTELRSSICAAGREARPPSRACPRARHLPHPAPLPSEYEFSGVRPSSGAEMQGEPVAFGQTGPLERADVAAADDRRTRLVSGSNHRTSRDRFSNWRPYVGAFSAPTRAQCQRRGEQSQERQQEGHCCGAHR